MYEQELEVLGELQAGLAEAQSGLARCAAALSQVREHLEAEVADMDDVANGRRPSILQELDSLRAARFAGSAESYSGRLA
ncbi:hypothetical protein [Corynebacterium lizhenjunii]|uniref:hypothetical protein n=1 Tax=Corynebacterium lizhenjunii TaxID=2709394 RepID=UPI0013EBBB4F|nr:hypothetical protein [Corynebacterium lizhenjunii]